MDHFHRYSTPSLSHPGNSVDHVSYQHTLKSDCKVPVKGLCLKKQGLN